MAQKGRRFSSEFKKKVALEALREQDTVQRIASRHKVHPNQVSAWKRQAVGRGCPGCSRSVASAERTMRRRSAICTRR